jgi:predicted outer membrane protein
LAQIAQQRSQNPAVQRFAQDILTQQAAQNRRLAELARTRNFNLPPANMFDPGNLTDNAVGNLRNQDVQPNQPVREPQTPDATGGRVPVRDPNLQNNNQFTVSPTDRELLTRLQGLSGPEFDRAFMSAIIDTRRQGLQNFESASQTMQDAQMRQLIGERVPTLRESQATALRLNETIGGARPTIPPGQPPNPLIK